MDACLSQNLADALQKMTLILHSPFATILKTLNLIPILLGKKKKKNLQTDLTKNMIDVNPKNRLKVA